MYKDSFTYLVIYKISAFISKLWSGSYVKTLIYGESKIDAGDSILAKLIGVINNFFGLISAKTAPVVSGSFICQCAFKCVYPAMLVTIAVIPLLPTKYVLALCLLSVLLFIFKWMFSGEIKLRFSLLDFFVLMFAVLIAYSIIISYIPSNSFFMGAAYILFILFYFVVRNTIDTKNKLKLVVWAMILAGGVVALFGIYQRITGQFYTMTDSWIDTEMFQTATRIYSTLENPNPLGEYLIFIIILSFSGLYFSKYKFVPLAVLGVSGLCMILTLSRGAWLGLAAALVVYTLIRDRRLVLLGLIAVMLMPLFMPQSIIERLTSIGDMSDSSTLYRVYIWMASLNMIKEFWSIGIGLGTNVFVFIYQKYSFAAVYAPHSHNLFLQLIIDLGISGILLFAGIIIMFYKGFLSKVNKTDDDFLKSAGAAVCAGMAGYLVQGLTDNVWYNYRVVAFFWVIIALAGTFAEMINVKKEVANEKFNKKI